jgi:hypothetical protein
MNLKTLLLLPVLTALAAFWTAPGETSDPRLEARELPLDILGGCEPSAACLEANDIHTRWIGRTPAGNLYMVWRAPCTESADCRAWVVEKSGNSVNTLLGLSGAYQLSRDAGPYPTVRVHTAVTDSQYHHVRYEWYGARYVRTDSRVVYRVDGVECGTQEECGTAAHEAMRQQQVDRAVKIWERVHGVSWI